MELELTEQHLLVGEKLLEEGKVTRLFENEPHLWIAHVDGFEVEIQISPSRVKAHSCECDVFEREKCCGHIAAGLLNLRRKLSETVSHPRQAKQQRTFAYQKLTVNAILESVTQDELAAFVRNFAKTNKQFSLALRAKFAAKVPLADNREKFGHLLDSAIQSYRKVNDRISAAGVGQLQKLLEELLGQADDATALEHFAESWAMLSAIVGRFSPILSKLDADEPKLHLQLQAAFEKIKQLAKSAIPPDLQDEIRQFCEAEFNRPAYRLNGFSGHLLGIWYSLANDDELSQIILDTLDKELAKPRLDQRYRSQLLLVKLDLLERPSFKASEDAFTLECLSEPQKLQQVIDALTPTGDYRPIKPLVEKGFRLIPDQALKVTLEGILLQIAQQEGKSDTITTISRQKFLETKDFSFYDKCRENNKANWDIFVKKLVGDLVRRHDYKQNLSTIATILGRENLLDDLLRLLEEQQSLDFLGQFDHFLIKKKPAEVFTLYERLLKEFLVSHLGLKASKRMRQIMDHLSALGADKIAMRLLESMRIAFPKRTFYLEEIDAL